MSERRGRLCGVFFQSRQFIFKDPAVTGTKICTYKTVTLDNAKVEGWFWNGVGTCANNAKKNCSVAEIVPSAP